MDRLPFGEEVLLALHENDLRRIRCGFAAAQFRRKGQNIRAKIYSLLIR